MIFPISVNFNRSLKTTITPEHKQQIFQYIKKTIVEDKADNVTIKDNGVTYKGSISNWNTSIFRSVDSGTFTLLFKENNWILGYRIDIRTLFIATAIMSTAAEFFGGLNGFSWWIGIAAFCWLCGGNWIISVIRHGSLASDIAIDIDELFFDKQLPIPPENEEDKERLKSWF